MDKNKIPNNVKSIIIAIDDELYEEFNKFHIKDGKVMINKQINIFLNLVLTLLQYYFNSLYKRIFTVNPSDNIIDEYNKKINNFVDTLTTALYQCIKLNIYDEIIEQIVIFVFNIYTDLYIKKINNDKTTVYILPNDFSLMPINSLINNIYELKKFKNKIDIIGSTIIFADKFENYSIDNITFKHIPIGLKPFINSILMKLNKKYITNKSIHFMDEKNVIYREDAEVFINYQQDINTIRYNIVYALIKDKLLMKIDDYWQQAFTKAMSNLHVADSCIHPNNYLYNLRAEMDYKEYFLNCYIAFLFDEEQLRIIDYNSYRRIKDVIIE